MIRPEELIIGLSRYESNDSTYAFVTRKVGNKIAREITLNNFKDPSKELLTIENTPVSGVRILTGSDCEAYVHGEKGSTRILDPRGFEWDMSLSSLHRLISSANISNGTIIDPVIYSFYGGEVHLTPNAKADNEYGKLKASDLVIGRCYQSKSGNGDEFCYMGYHKVFKKKNNNNPYWVVTDTVRIGKNQHVFVDVRSGTISLTTHRSLLNDYRTASDQELQQFEDALRYSIAMHSITDDLSPIIEEIHIECVSDMRGEYANSRTLEPSIKHKLNCNAHPSLNYNKVLAIKISEREFAWGYVHIDACFIKVNGVYTFSGENWDHRPVVSFKSEYGNLITTEKSIINPLKAIIPDISNRILREVGTNLHIQLNSKDEMVRLFDSGIFYNIFVD